MAKEKSGDEARRLALLLQRGVRTLMIVQVVTLVMYSVYRTQVPSTTNSALDRITFGLTTSVGALNAFTAIMAIAQREWAMTSLQVIMFFSGFGICVDSYTLWYTPQTRFVNTTLAAQSFVLVLDVVFFFVAAAGLAGFSPAAWAGYESLRSTGEFDPFGVFAYEVATARPLPEADAALKDLEMPLTRGERKRAARLAAAAQREAAEEMGDDDGDDEEVRHLRRRGTRFALGLLYFTIPFELTVLFFYVLYQVGFPSEQYSGWIFGLHFFTAMSALAWLQERGRPLREPRAAQWLTTLALSVLVLDAMQMAGVRLSDVPAIVAFRGVLLACTVLYVVAMYGAYVTYRAPTHAAVMFCALQFGAVSLVVFEGSRRVPVLCVCVCGAADAAVLREHHPRGDGGGVSGGAGGGAHYAGGGGAGRRGVLRAAVGHGERGRGPHGVPAGGAVPRDGVGRAGAAAGGERGVSGDCGHRGA